MSEEEKMLLQLASKEGDSAYQAGAKSALERFLQKSRNDAAIAQLLKKQEIDKGSYDTLKADVEAAASKGKKITGRLGDAQYGVSEMAPLDAQMQKLKTQANITGYDQADPSVIPTSKDAEEVKSATSAFKSMKTNQELLDDNLSKANWLDRMGAVHIPLVGPVGTQRGRNIDAEIGELLMEGKNIQKLGALQAPEIKLMERIQGSVTGLGSLFQDKDEVRDRLKELITRARDRVKEGAFARGYTPQPGYLDNTGTGLAKTPKAPSPEEDDFDPATAQNVYDEAAKDPASFGSDTFTPKNANANAPAAKAVAPTAPGAKPPGSQEDAERAELEKLRAKFGRQKKN